MFDISVIGPKTQNFVPANISYIYMHYKALEFIDPVSFSRTNRKFSTRKLCFKPKSQKNVPANNCHPKLY